MFSLLQNLAEPPIQEEQQPGMHLAMNKKQPQRNRARRLVRNLLRVGTLLHLLLSSVSYAAESLDCLIEPYQVVDLSSPEIGVLGSVRVDEADVVRTGDVVAALHDDVERAALKLSRARAAAHAEIELLQHDHEFNTRKRNRVDQLQDQLAVSTQSADEVRTAEELARLRLSAAREKQRTVQLEASRDALALERRTVRSPFNGVIAKRYKSAGEYVDGDPIVQLVQLDPLRIQVVAPIEMFGQISVGMVATVLPELAIDGRFEASVISVDPVMDAATATFGVRLSLPNPEQRLPPGLKCTLVMQEPDEPVPATAPQSPSPAVAHVTPSPETSLAPAQPSPGDTNMTEPQDMGLLVDQCATLGPISGTLKADALEATLAANNIDSERRYTPGATVSAKWIILSSDVSASPASLVERARQANIGDFQLLTRGAWKNRLSFGTYRGEKSALRRMRQINELGFNAEVLNRENANSPIWLDLTRVPSGLLLETLVGTTRDDRPALTVQPIPCAQLASR